MTTSSVNLFGIPTEWFKPMAVAFVGGAVVVFAVETMIRQKRGRSSTTLTASDATSSGEHVTGSIGVVRAGKTITIQRKDLQLLVSECLVKVGATIENADMVASVLVAADERGIPSHGVNRLEIYVAEIEAGLVDPKAQPFISVNDGATTTTVDGNNALGAVVSTFCTDIAIRKAKKFGTGMVACNNSNHFGIAGYYSMLAAEQGMLGLSFTNTSPFVVPTRAMPGTGTALGTNAISCAGNAANDDEFVLDMATSSVAVGKVEVYHRKGVAMPTGWGLNKFGEDTTDPASVLPSAGGALLPLGGTEETSGYKGYALGMLIEILCGVLPNAAVGADVQPWNTQRAMPINYGHCFIVIDPQSFQSKSAYTPTFQQRLKKYLDQMRALPVLPTAPGPVLVPGDPERAFAESSKQSGIEINIKIATSVRNIATRLNVELPLVLQELEGDAPRHHAV
eukprot:m.180316 g.180316  ORF g.180316 m.180316 type:complete len:452 (+) comp32017_c0_seq1:265-1620(+)